MPAPRKVVLHSVRGYRPGFDALVASWIARGVRYVGVVGADAARLEDVIDELSLARGEWAFILTATHDADETLEDAVALAAHIDEVQGVALGSEVELVEF